MEEERLRCAGGVLAKCWQLLWMGQWMVNGLLLCAGSLGMPGDLGRAVTPSRPAASTAALAFACRRRPSRPWPRRARSAHSTCSSPTSRARPTPAAHTARSGRARGGAGSTSLLPRTVWSCAQCVAGESPVKTNQSGPAPPPAQPTIPRVITGPWHPQLGSCAGHLRPSIGAAPAGHGPLATGRRAAIAGEHSMRPCMRKSSAR